MASNRFNLSKDQAGAARAIARDLKKKLKDRHNLKKVNKGELEQIAELYKKNILSRVEKGVSPIAGNNRFPAYKNPTNYPDKVKTKYRNKRRRPVNLFLSGDFYKALKYKVKTGFNPYIRIGFFDKKNKEKEKGHRDGAKGQPRRPIIPIGGEKFKPAIFKELATTLAKILDKAFRRR